MNTPWELIDAFLDEEISPAQETELREWLTADREHLRALVRATHLHRSLRTELLARKVLPLEPVLDRTVEEEFEGVLFGAASPSSPAGTRGEIGSALHDRVPLRRPGFGRFIRTRGALLAMAASLVLFIGLSVWVFPSVNNEPTLAISLGTRVMIERGGQSIPAPDGLKLLPGDLLRVSGSNGAAIGYGNENTRVTLDDDTELKTLAWRTGKHFELRQGKLEAMVARQRPFGPMVLLTTQAEVRVVGTKFTLAASTNATRLEVSEGRVKLTRTSDDASIKVSAGYYAVAAANDKLTALPQTGGLSREWWTGVIGQTEFGLREDPRFPDHPDGRDTVRNFELKVTETNRLGVRLRGYLHPPVTGDYEFWLAYSLPDSSHADLIMSSNENGADEVEIAQTGTHNRQSPPIPLVAGRCYYIEALVLIPQGGGHLSVEWKRPGGTRELLTGGFLSPFKPKPNKR